MRASCTTTGGCSAIIGVAAGGLSGLLGIGGGILMVPAFSAWVGLPLKETIATSLACVGIFAIPGTITHAVQGDIDWTFAIPLAIGVIPGAQSAPGSRSRATTGRCATPSASRSPSSPTIYAIGEIIALCCASATAHARSKTASSIGGVSRPVNVFC